MTNPLLFNHLLNHSLFRQLTGWGTKPPRGKKKSQFLEAILGGEKKKAKIDMERLIQLYDGPPWVIQKGNQSARQVCLLYKLCAIVLCDGPGLSSPSPGPTC